MIGENSEFKIRYKTTISVSRAWCGVKESMSVSKQQSQVRHRTEQCHWKDGVFIVVPRCLQLTKCHPRYFVRQSIC